MQIAVCDDDKYELARISSLLDIYQREKNAPISYRCFHSATELLSTVKCGEYVLFLLDILMPGINGMQAAQEFRKFDTDAKLVFLTSSPEFAVKSYEVRAMDYILKPVSSERLFTLLDQLIHEYQAPDQGLSVKTKSGIARILFSKLAYVEAAGKRIRFHLSDGSSRDVTATLGEFEPMLLARPEFIRVHRSYIVNLWQVKELAASGIMTHGDQFIPVSRRLYGAVRDAYVEQLWGGGGDGPCLY